MHGVKACTRQNLGSRKIARHEPQWRPKEVVRLYWRYYTYEKVTPAIVPNVRAKPENANNQYAKDRRASCFRCGKTVHKQFDCVDVQASLPAPPVTEVLMCSICVRRAHHETHCRFRREDHNSQPRRRSDTSQGILPNYNGRNANSSHPPNDNSSNRKWAGMWDLVAIIHTRRLVIITLRPWRETTIYLRTLVMFVIQEMRAQELIVYQSYGH